MKSCTLDQANANLGASATITIAQLPMDISETADCANNTIQVRNETTQG